MWRYHYIRKVIKTGLEQTLDHVRSLMWRFQRLPFTCLRNTKEKSLRPRVSVFSQSMLHQNEICVPREQTPSGSWRRRKRAGFMSPTAIVVCGNSLHTESSKRLEELRSVGCGVRRGPQESSQGKQCGCHIQQEHFETEHPRSLAKPRWWL